MIKLKSIKKIQLVLWLATLLSCTPEEIDFPEEDTTDPLLFSKSNAIVSLFNEINKGTASFEDLCFEFNYPITLRTNSEIALTINNQEGLEELIQNQTSGVFVDQVVFPISISGSDQSTITNEQSFQELLFTCNIDPFADDFIFHYQRCFEFRYPFQLNDESSSSEIGSYEQLLDYYEVKPDKFLLDIEYPVTTTNDETIQNDFELYQVLNTCRFCPEISFEEEVIDGSLILKANSDYLNEIGTYSWYINDVFQEEDGPDLEGDNLLNVREIVGFPSQFEVCIKAEFEDCDETLIFCDEVIIESECPEELGMTIELTDDNTFPDKKVYKFKASSDLIQDDAILKWFINDDLIESGSFDNVMEIQQVVLEAGDYNVCLVYESIFCPEEAEVCQDLIVDIPNDCPDLFFGFQNQDNQYSFFADFLGIEELEWYGWYVNGDLVDEEGTISGGDNQLFFTFQEPGVYEVCIKTETPECPLGTEFCVEIII